MKRYLVALLALGLAALATPASSENRYLVTLACGEVDLESLADRLGGEWTVAGQGDEGAGPGARRVITFSEWLPESHVEERLSSEPCVERAERIVTVNLLAAETSEQQQALWAANSWLRQHQSAAALRAFQKRQLAAGDAHPAYLDQEAMTLVRAPASQATFGTGAGVVAVIDTGVDPHHPILAGSMVPGYDFVMEREGSASEWTELDPDTAAVLDQSTVAVLEQSTVAVLEQSTVAVLEQSTVAVLEQAMVNQSTVAVLERKAAEALSQPRYRAFGHGTLVSGLIRLVAPAAKIMPLKAFRADGSADTSDIIRAIYYAVEKGADVINMSFSFKEPSAELLHAVRFATKRGAIVVAAAGNEGRKTLVYPAAYREVLGVGATTLDDERSEISNYGESLVSLAAPGEAVVTTYPGGNYAAVFGTSFSTAIVSGAASLLLSLEPETDQSQATEALSRAKRLTPELGYGRIDIFEALRHHRQSLRSETR